ncbi:MAG TPA: HD domain-containing phosphohydrolase [Vicinamibacterales bacterium]
MFFDLVIPADGRAFTIRPGAPLTIGRMPQCDVQVDDQAVSRKHCSVEAAADALLVLDLGSANGTFLNDQPIERAPMAPGDRLRVGSTVLECRRSDPKVSDHTAYLTSDHSTVESVIRKRIEPSQFEWLAADQPAAPDQALLRRAQRHLSMLHSISELLAGARDTQTVSDDVLRAVLDVTGADRGALLLRRDPGGNGDDTIQLIAAYTKQGGSGGERFAVSRTIVSDVIGKGVSTFAHDATADARFKQGQSVIGQRIRSVMCVPLRTSDAILGALYVDTLSGPGRFNDADLELLAAVGNQAGVALHRVRLLGDLERLLLDTVRAIAATVDAKDGYTHRHSERVAALSRRLAAEIGEGPDLQGHVELSALLHDVGKIAVPDSILNKPGKLEPEEFAAMKEHPVHGARILANIQSPLVIAILPGVRHHHERWDGTGYPDGLAGVAIPLLGRIIGVADFVDALTSARSYRGAMTIDATAELIRRGSGKHFDPRIADAALALYERGKLAP